jgi:hypothetical protein
MCRLYTDLFSSLIANDYAEYLKSNEDDPEIFKQLYLISSLSYPLAAMSITTSVTLNWSSQNPN